MSELYTEQSWGLAIMIDDSKMNEFPQPASPKLPITCITLENFVTKRQVVLTTLDSEFSNPVGRHNSIDLWLFSDVIDCINSNPLEPTEIHQLKAEFKLLFKFVEAIKFYGITSIIQYTNFELDYCIGRLHKLGISIDPLLSLNTFNLLPLMNKIYGNELDDISMNNLFEIDGNVPRTNDCDVSRSIAVCAQYQSILDRMDVASITWNDNA